MNGLVLSNAPFSNFNYFSCLFRKLVVNRRRFNIFRCIYEKQDRISTRFLGSQQH